MKMRRPSAKEIATVPNAISVAGFGLTVAGSVEADPTKSLALTAAGRAMDLADGVAARALGQESEFGAKLDATLDKLGMAAIIGSAVRRGTIPAPAATAMIAHNALNAGASIAHQLRHPDQPARPTKTGKAGLFIENIAAFSYMAAHAVESKKPGHTAARTLKIAGHILTAAGVGLGAIAGAQYIRRAAGSTESEPYSDF